MGCGELFTHSVHFYPMQIEDLNKRAKKIFELKAFGHVLRQILKACLSGRLTGLPESIQPPISLGAIQIQVLSDLSHLTKVTKLLRKPIFFLPLFSTGRPNRHSHLSAPLFHDQFFPPC